MKNVATLLSAFLMLGSTTVAQPGSLDGSFGINGKVTTDFGTYGDAGSSITFQPDGKIVVAGTSSNIVSGANFALIRYNTDGTLDYNFGVGGKTTTDFLMDSDGGHSVAIQPDGKIVVAGFAYNGSSAFFAVARYNTNGTLDNSFGIDGKVTTDFGTLNDQGKSVVIQLDGKIVVAGYSVNSSGAVFAVARYNADGTLDNSFGAAGKVSTAFGMGSDYGTSVAIQPDGRIVVSGSSYNGSDADFAVARYNTDGSLDNSFSVDGKVTTDFGTGNDYGNSVAIQSDGKIIVFGYSYNGSDADFAVVRYNTDGSLDSNFGVDGKTTTAVGVDDDFGYSVTIQPDGKIIVAGTAYISAGNDFAVVRYNTNGDLDNSFGAGGKVTTDLRTGYDAGYAVALQLDGKIVVAGNSEYMGDNDFAIARYISGLDIGIIDLSFVNNTPLIYPNPIDRQATLEYTLQGAETISIHLLDMQGRTVQTFVEGQQQAAGEHQQAIALAEDLPSGSYLIAISSPKGRLTVQVVK